ncbi:MAG: polyphosphate polymerase domain-containing protein [Salinivirgaceae bacterium]|jgi:hypothetical protein
MNANSYSELLTLFRPVNLNQLNHLKLMNRMDSKFVLPIHLLPIILKEASAFYQILEIENQRSFLYKTEYLDSPEMSLYLEHHNQRLSRYKIRYRTYTQSGTTFLEIKRKTNKEKTLKSRIEVCEESQLSEPHYQFIESVVPLKERSLHVSSTNFFNRITLISFESNERITLDFGLTMENQFGKTSLNHVAIAEVKREKQTGSSPFFKILKTNRIYQRGFSKYCIGVALLNPKLKQNSFKPTITYLNKLNYEPVTN